MVSFAYLQVVYILKKWFDYYENSCQFFWKFKFLSYYYYAKNSEKIVPPYYSIWFYFSLLLPCFWSLFVMFYSKILPFFRSSFSFLVGKIAGKRWHRKEIKKFSLLFHPHILCQLCEWWCWMDAMKNKIKKVFLTHITAHSTLWLSLISSSSF